MKKIIYVCSLALCALCMTGCEDFLDSESLTKKNTGNFPLNETDAQQMIAGIYTVMNNNLEVTRSLFLIWPAMTVLAAVARVI